MSLCLTGVALYTVIRYYKNVPGFYMNADSIVFKGNTVFFWKDLERIELAGKRPFKYMLSYAREGMMLKFKGSNEIYLFDDMYTSTATVKRFITCHVVKKTRDTESSIIGPKISDALQEQYIAYSGNQLLNYRGVLLWCMLALLLYGIIMNNNVIFTVFLLGLSGSCFLWLSAYMYSFGLSDNYLVVRNPNLFWIKKAYRLNDIKEVVFEQQHSKLPYSLRIITADFESDLYMAGTLWNKKWVSLQKDLESKNIKVRNECII
ncbi:hypothetical protein [Mucilaginibacter sp. SP1R1]|uniref:hypothetical protein n=1 Tax=Mucilaginibacter sp. SP1R1 TaxID=2723091 RepID=UPI001615749B|nr:hypothetical protein [Mucilaginibacter sp. SP1R1]MBB6152132.1 hypothetical protein [Mucilaginibacter sp. SP1R1]